MYKDNMIFIGVNKNKPEGIKVIWRVLHEFGHHRDDTYPPITAKSTPTDIINREEEAWVIASQSELIKYPKLIEL